MSFEDLSTFGPDGQPKLDLSGQTITGARVIAERVARRWLVTPGTIPDAPNVGAGLLRLENHDPTDGELAQWMHLLESEAQAENGVVSCKVTWRRFTETDTLVISGRLLTVEGYYAIEVRAADAVGVFFPEGV